VFLDLFLGNAYRRRKLILLWDMRSPRLDGSDETIWAALSCGALLASSIICTLRQWSRLLPLLRVHFPVAETPTPRGWGPLMPVIQELSRFEKVSATRSGRSSSAPLLTWTAHHSFCLLAQSLSRSAALKALCSNCVLSPVHQRNRRSRQDIRLSSCGAGTLRTQAAFSSR
jgi:hypothetical protein